VDKKTERQVEVKVGNFRNLTVLVILAACSLSSSALGAEQIAGVHTHTVYVPAYSHVYGGPSSHVLNLSTTLTVRNTDPRKPIRVLSIHYYNSRGQLVRELLEKPMSLAALASTHVIVAERDETGGPGPCFLVKWSATEPVSPVLVQGIMVTTKSGLGLSFLTQGVEINAPFR
jgi:hypothetical protein